MKRLLFILFVILTITGYSQRTVDANTVNVRTYLIVEGDTIDFSDYITTSSEIYKLLFDNDTVAPAYQEGILFYDSLTNSLSYYNDASDITVNIAQEQIAAVYNNDVVAGIIDGQVCYADTASGLPFVELAKADIFTSIENVIGVATHNIAHRDSGYITTFGAVRGINTSSWSVGDQLYISAATAGMLTNVKPEYPNFTIAVAQVLISDASNGVILVNKIGKAEDIIFNSFVGNFLEGFDFLITSNGTTITGTLTNTGGGDYLTMNFSDGWQLLDVNPGATITLTPGTDANPQLQYVYIPKTTKVLTVSTAGFPDAQHIPVAQVVAQSALGTSYHGALRNQNVNNHLASTDGQGHITEMGARIRKMPCQWESGVEGTATINPTPSPDEVTLSNTGGKAWQMHLQDFPAQDMATGDSIHIINDFTTPYKTVIDLGSELTDATGSSLSGKHFSFVMWGVANKGADSSHVMLNLPTGSYNSSSSAVDDALGYSVYDIPTIYNGVGFLIARFTFTHSASGGGTWTLVDTEDLRGKFPSTSAGGGGGGGGVTTLLGLTDMPNSFISQAGKYFRVAAGETAGEFVSPIVTTKGDLFTFSTVESRLGVGTNGYFLSANSAQATGLEWVINPSLWEVTTDTRLKTPDDVFIEGALTLDGELDLNSNSIVNAASLSVGGSSSTGMIQVNGDGVYSSLGRYINNANDTILSIDDDGGLWGQTINTSLDNDTYLGDGAGGSNTTGNSSSVGIGKNALASQLPTGTNNTVVGKGAGDAITSQDNNTLLGTNAGGAIISNWNTIVGSSAGFAITSSSSNCLFGYSAYSGTGANNSIFGHQAGGSSTQWNAMFGYRSGQNATGQGNALFGMESGKACVSGNVMLGYQAGMLFTGSNELFIDNSSDTTPLIHGDFATDIVTINDVLVIAPRASAPTSPVEGMIYSNSTDNHLYFYNGTSWVQLDN